MLLVEGRRVRRRSIFLIQAGSELQMSSGGKSPKNTFPDDRAASRVAVVAINPYLLHIWWHISGQHFEDIQGAPGESPEDARVVLRSYDITCILFDGTNAHQTFDVEVDPRTQQWKVPIWSAGKSYVIELGYKALDGRFHQIARSNIVHVPRAGPSPRRDERYLCVEDGQIKGPAPMPVVYAPGGEPEEVPRSETVHGMGKDTGEPSEREAVPSKAVDAARAGQGSKGAAIHPCHGPKRAVYPFDLVDLTEKRFSFGVSSPMPTRGTSS